MPDLADHRLRTKLEAAILERAAPAVHERYGERKAAAIGAMRGTVVELGPGTGANLRYYAPGVRVVGIEPNPEMQARLRARADAIGVDLEVRTLRGEAIDVDDASADGVVATLVLCGVDDPEQVLREVRRILKPGAPFFFFEHVVAPDGTWTRRVQRVVRRPHRWLFNGCNVDRDTERLLRSAGFAEVQIEHEDEGAAGLHVRHRIIGSARTPT